MSVLFGSTLAEQTLLQIKVQSPRTAIRLILVNLFCFFIITPKFAGKFSFCDSTKYYIKVKNVYEFVKNAYFLMNYAFFWKS